MARFILIWALLCYFSNATKKSAGAKAAPNSAVPPVSIEKVLWEDLTCSTAQRRMGFYGVFAERASYPEPDISSEMALIVKKDEPDANLVLGSIPHFIERCVALLERMQTASRGREHNAYLLRYSNLVGDPGLYKDFKDTGNALIKLKRLSSSYQQLATDPAESTDSDMGTVAEEAGEAVPVKASELMREGSFFRELYQLVVSRDPLQRMDTLIEEVHARRSSFQLTLLLTVFLTVLPGSVRRASFAGRIIRAGATERWRPHWLSPHLPSRLLPVVLDYIRLADGQKEDLSAVFGDLWLPTVSLPSAAEHHSVIVKYDAIAIGTASRLHSTRIRSKALLQYAKGHPDFARQCTLDYRRAVANDDEALAGALAEVPRGASYVKRNHHAYAFLRPRMEMDIFAEMVNGSEFGKNLKESLLKLYGLYWQLKSYTSSPFSFACATLPQRTRLFPRTFVQWAGGKGGEAGANKIFAAGEKDPLNKLLRENPATFPAVYGKLQRRRLLFGCSASATVIRLRPIQSGLAVKRVKCLPNAWKGDDGARQKQERRQPTRPKWLEARAGDVFVVAMDAVDLGLRQLVSGWFGRGRDRLVALTARLHDLGLEKALILAVEQH